MIQAPGTPLSPALDALRLAAVRAVTHCAGPQTAAELAGATTVPALQIALRWMAQDCGFSAEADEALCALIVAVADAARPVYDALTPAPSGLASRVRVYEMAALGDALAFPHLAGCAVDGATAAAMAVERRRDGRELRRVLHTAGVSL